MNKKIIFAVVFITMISVAINAAYARISVAAVNGSVAYKTDYQWLPLNPGMELAEGTKISTGVNSYAVLLLNNHQVVVNPLSMMKIYANSVIGANENTQIGLRRGSIRAKVAKTERIKTVFTISTPVATSSVRGTEKIDSFGPARGMRVKFISGSGFGTTKNGVSKILSGKLVFSQKQGNASPMSPLSDVVETADVRVYDDNLTSDEKGMNAFNSDSVENGDNPVITLNNLNPAKSATKINIKINWP